MVGMHEYVAVFARHSHQFRWKIFNILNHANFAVPASATIVDVEGNKVSANDTINPLKRLLDKCNSR